MIARLQCFCCDRDDWDSMIPGPGDAVLLLNPTVREMREAAAKAGWGDIHWLPPETPESFNWATHYGECPECLETTDQHKIADYGPLFTEPAG